MKCNNKDLEKAKLYEIIDAGIDPRENIIFQMLNEKWRKDFLTEEYTRGEEIEEAKGRIKSGSKLIKRMLKMGMNIETISSLVDVPISEI